MTTVKSEFVKVDMAAALNPNNAGDSPTVKLIGLSRQRRGIAEEVQTVHAQLEANTILRDREFSFCLYPAEKIRPFMTNL